MSRLGGEPSMRVAQTRYIVHPAARTRRRPLSRSRSGAMNKFRPQNVARQEEPRYFVRSFPPCVRYAPRPPRTRRCSRCGPVAQLNRTFRIQLAESEGVPLCRNDLRVAGRGSTSRAIQPGLFKRPTAEICVWPNDHICAIWRYLLILTTG